MMDPRTIALQFVRSSVIVIVDLNITDSNGGGVACARNRGLSLANGEFIAFVDNDDVMSPRMYETLIALIKEKNVDVSVCGHKQFHGTYEAALSELSEASDFTDLKPEILSNKQDIFWSIVKGHGIEGLIWNKVYTRAIIGEHRFDEKVDLVDDAVFSCNLFLSVKSVCYIPNPFYYWMQHRTNQTKSSSYERYANACRAYDGLIELFQKNEISSKSTNVLKSQCLLWNLNTLDRYVSEDIKSSEKKAIHIKAIRKYINYKRYYSKIIKFKLVSAAYCYPLYWCYIKLRALKRG